MSGEDAFESFAENLENVLLTNSKSKLRQIAQLPEDWDGESAARPDMRALSSATYSLELLVSGSRRVGLAWIEPLITATPDGDVVMEWWKMDRKLSLYFSASGAEFIRILDRAPNPEMEDGKVADLALIDLWRWLASS